jgi:SAM-dependent methyltransferase
LKAEEIPPTVWETPYQYAGIGRLWPGEPTIDWPDFDVDRWRSLGVRIVLDGGCGDGKNLAYLVRQGFFIVGTDASRSALVKCRRYLQEQALPREYLLLAPNPLEQLPLLDEAVDAAICVDVLGHVTEPVPILREIARAVRKGGLIYASVFSMKDGCRTGPRMRPNQDNPREFWYQPSDQNNPRLYFRFYDEVEARRMFETSGLRLRSISSHGWNKPPHPGYRDEPHHHDSWFAMLERSV